MSAMSIGAAPIGAVPMGMASIAGAPSSVASTGASATSATLTSPGTLLALAAVALVVAGALALAMRREPRAFPLLALLALPFRLPISADGRTVNLLLPLYAVVAAGALAHLLPRVPRTAHLPPRVIPPRVTPRILRGGARAAYKSGRPTMALDWLLATAVGLYAIQIVYSADPSKGAENLVFFYLPFALLYVLLREAPWTPGLLLACLGVVVALAVLFVGVGDVEYLRKSLFLNPKVVAANEYDNYFRVNSLFFDPSIYGRFLALVMIAVTTLVLWSRGRREQLLGAGVLAWLLVGLVTSFSQSSIAALLLGLAVLAAWRWDARGTVYVALALAAIAAVVVLVAPPSLHFGLRGASGSANNATSGRAKLVSGGLDLFAERPLIGYGSGSFEVEYRRHSHRATAASATSASHTIPVTVVAEQGIVGLALYAALLAAAFATLIRGAGRSPPRIALAACFAALVLHTWVYADFLEDPMTWTLLGIGIALGSAPARNRAADEPASRRGATPTAPVPARG